MVPKKTDDIQDKVDDVKDAIENIEDKITESADGKQVDLDALQAELEQARKENESLRKDLKDQTQAAQKHSKDSQKWQDEVTSINQRIDASNARFDALAEAIEDLITNRDAEEYSREPQPKQRTSYKDRIQALEKDKPDPNLSTQQTHMKEVANEIVNLLQPHGIEFDRSKDLKEAYNEWRFGNFDEALSLVKEKVQEMEVKKAESEKKPELDEQEIERRVQEEVRKALEEKGLLDVDNLVPSGMNKTEIEAEQEFIKTGNMDNLPESVKRKYR